MTDITKIDYDTYSWGGTPNAVAFDTETTGLGKDARIVEIGFVMMEEAKITASESILINPEIEIPYQASDIHHIYDDDVKDAPTFDVVLPRILEWLTMGPWIAHNMVFDTRILKQDMLRVGKNPGDHVLKDLPTLCTLRAAKKRGHRRARLGDLARHFNIDQQDAHRACDDARVCALMAVEMMRGISIKRSSTKPSIEWF